MTLVTERARSTVRAGAEEQLVTHRPAMIAALRERVPELLAAYLTRKPETAASWTSWSGAASRKPPRPPA